MANRETQQMTNVRLKVSNLIDRYGNDIIIRSPGSATQDAWGEPVLSSQVDVNTVGVTDGYILARMQLTSVGRLKEGESIILVKGDETVDETYTIEIDSTEYNIMQVEPFKAAEIVAAYQLVIGSK